MYVSKETDWLETDLNSLLYQKEKEAVLDYLGHYPEYNKDDIKDTIDRMWEHKRVQRLFRVNVVRSYEEFKAQRRRD